MAQNSVVDIVMKGSDVEDVAGRIWGVIEVFLGTSNVVGVIRASGGTVDTASGIGGAGACGTESIECSSCGASSAYGGSATGTE